MTDHRRTETPAAGDAALLDAVLKAERTAEARIENAHGEAARRREAARERARAIEACAAARIAAVRQRFEQRLDADVAALAEKARQETGKAGRDDYDEGALAAAAAAVAARLGGGDDDPPR